MNMKSILVKEATKLTEVPKEFITKNFVINNCVLPANNDFKDKALKYFKEEYGPNIHIKHLAIYVNGLLQTFQHHYYLISDDDKVTLIWLGDGLVVGDIITFKY